MTSTPMPSNPAWFNDLALKDRFGDRIHQAIALILLAVLPCNSAVAGGFFGALVVWYLVRLYYWKPYMLSGPARILVPGIIWIAYLALTLAWSPDTSLGFRGVWANRWILIVAALWPLMARWPQLLLAILVGSLVQAGAQIIGGIIDWNSADSGLIAGLNEHPRTSAAWIAATAVGVFGLYLAGWLKKWHWLLALVPLLCAMMLSHSRGALLACFIGVVVVTVVLAATRQLRSRRLLSLVVAIVMAAGLFLAFQSRITPAAGKAYESTAHMIKTGELKDIRLVWWKSSFRQWQNHPIFGYGAGGTAYALKTDEQLKEDGRHLSADKQEKQLVFNQPHSTYFQVLLEGGLVGIALFGFLLGSMVFMGIRTARHHPVGAIALGGLSVWMVTAAFDSWHTQGQTLALLWVVGIFASTHPHCYRPWDKSAADQPEEAEAT
ncbi:MAG: O-antigen ligase family protein [Phycisphaerales bacterium]|nr:O-antigen ligase family protein [Phycisphaerales bacterium]